MDVKKKILLILNGLVVIGIFVLVFYFYKNGEILTINKWLGNFFKYSEEIDFSSNLNEEETRSKNVVERLIQNIAGKKETESFQGGQISVLSVVPNSALSSDIAINTISFIVEPPVLVNTPCIESLLL